RADVLREEHDRADTDEVERVAAGAHDEIGLGPGYRVYEPTRVTAREVMSPTVITLHESSNIGQAASLMAYEGVHHLPVVSDRGAVVGILSAIDVLRWLGRQSGYIIPPGPTRRRE